MPTALLQFGGEVVATQITRQRGSDFVRSVQDRAQSAPRQEEPADNNGVADHCENQPRRIRRRSMVVGAAG